MYLKIDEKTYKKIKERTWTDYEKVGDFIPAENIMAIIDDLLYEIDRKEEELRDLEQDIEDNYRPIPVSEQYEISDRDFI